MGLHPSERGFCFENTFPSTLPSRHNACNFCEAGKAVSKVNKASSLVCVCGRVCVFHKAQPVKESYCYLVLYLLLD